MRTMFASKMFTVRQLKSCKPMVGSIVVGVLLLSLVPAAHATLRYVASNGVDGPSCGTSSSPCRSITQAIANAVEGDTITVGPGFYSRDTGETGSPDCACMLSVYKRLIVISSNGAAATVLDATTALLDQNVLIIADGVEFGRPDHGFTVLPTGASGRNAGIAIDGTNIKVRGNQVVNIPNIPQTGHAGIITVDADETILIQNNQVIGWQEVGILIFGPGKTVSQNQVSMNATGIRSHNGNTAITGNVATNNFNDGIDLYDASRAVGNAVYGNKETGFFVQPSFTGVIQKNNIFGNRVGNCGLLNDGVSGLNATANYWGAKTGPGPDPADDVCNFSGGTTTTSPFATTRYVIDPNIEP